MTATGVSSTDEQHTLMVFPTTGRVNAEWELIIDRSTGEVTQGMVATVAEPPPE